MLYAAAGVLVGAGADVSGCLGIDESLQHRGEHEAHHLAAVGGVEYGYRRSIPANLGGKVPLPRWIHETSAIAATGASHRRLSACGRPKLLSAQIRMSGCLSAARMASGWTLAAWSKLIPNDSR